MQASRSDAEGRNNQHKRGPGEKTPCDINHKLKQKWKCILGAIKLRIIRSYTNFGGTATRETSICIVSSVHLLWHAVKLLADKNSFDSKQQLHSWEERQRLQRERNILLFIISHQNYFIYLNIYEQNTDFSVFLFLGVRRFFLSRSLSYSRTLAVCSMWQELDLSRWESPEENDNNALVSLMKSKKRTRTTTTIWRKSVVIILLCEWQNKQSIEIQSEYTNIS